MSIGLIARVKIIAGKEGEFESAFAWQAEQVRANEPGNKLYKLFRSREQAGSYVVMEIYDDEAAIDAHRNSEHMKANRPKTAPLIAEPTVIELYDAV
jgi:quinol monooxygenase YgiN